MNRIVNIKLALGFILLALLMIPATVSVQAAPSAVPALDVFLTNCVGSYYNNMSLSGSPVWTNTTDTVNHFWDAGVSPGPGVNTSQYSVGWSCSISIPADGTYTITAVTDDGMNILVDGSLLLWAWYDQGPTTYVKTGFLTAGTHTLNVQYYNNTQGGTAQVSVNTGSSPAPSFPDWKGEYYNNLSLSGTPVLTRDDVNINFDWGFGSPGPSVNADDFSVRWTRSLYFTAGTWQFTTTTDDGVRLWVDGVLLIDHWVDQSATTWSNTISLAAGTHAVRMEYYDNVLSAVAKLSITPATSPTQAWFCQFYNNTSLSGSPVWTTSTDPLNYNWFEGSPGPGVNADNFSAKCDANKTFTSGGNFTVNVTSDDGVRLWVDGVLVVDAWYDHAPTTFTYAKYFSVGSHSFHVEYYDHTLGAVLQVLISGSVTPSSDIIVDDRGVGWQAGGCYYCWYNAGGYGGHSFWTYNNTFAVYGYNWARWYPTLPAARNYEVFAYIPGGIATTTNARYWIYHAGFYNLAARGQIYFPNQWVSLGRYYFNGLGGENVSLSDVTGECYLCRTLVFDAMKFSPR